MITKNNGVLASNELCPMFTVLMKYSISKNYIQNLHKILIIYLIVIPAELIKVENYRDQLTYQMSQKARKIVYKSIHMLVSPLVGLSFVNLLRRQLLTNAIFLLDRHKSIPVAYTKILEQHQ